VSYARYIVFLQALLAIFIAGGIFFKRKTLKNWSMSIFILVFGLEMLVFLYGTSAVRYVYPGYTAWLYFLPGFIYGPILYIHFKCVLFGEKYKPKKIEFLHLLPFVLVLVYSFDFFMLSGLELESFLHRHFLDRIMPINYARALHQLVYAIILAYLMYSNFKVVDRAKRFYLTIISIIYTLATLIVSFYTLFADTWRDFIFYYLTASFLILFLAYVLIYNPDFFKRIGGKYKTSGLKDIDLKRIENRMDQLLEQDKLFLKNNLTISEVSKRLNIPSHHISQMLSTNVKMTFNQYVNEKRINHAKSILAHPKNNMYKIEALSLEMGFNNKVTFYKAFKKHVGMTPSQFKKEKQKALAQR